MNAIGPLKVDHRSAGAMPDDIAISTPQFDRWREVLTNSPRDSRGLIDWEAAELVPLDQIELIRRDIERSLTPSDRTWLTKRATMLLMAYPQRVDEQSATVWIASVAEDLAEYPPHIVCAAMIEVRRSIKFIPTIAELREICDRHLGRARVPLLRLEAHERQHRIREEQARRQAERARQAAAKRQAFADQLREHYGADGPTPDDAEDAWMMLWRWNFGQPQSSSLAAMGRWRRALDVGEPWAGAICRIAAKWAREHRGDDGRIEPPSPKVAKSLIALRDAHCLTAEAA